MLSGIIIFMLFSSISGLIHAEPDNWGTSGEINETWKMVLPSVHDHCITRSLKWVLKLPGKLTLDLLLLHSLHLSISSLFNSSETSDRSTLSSLLSVSSLPLAEYLLNTCWPGTGGSGCWVYLWPKGGEFIFSYRLWSISKEVFIHMLDGDQSGEMKTSHGR